MYQKGRAWIELNMDNLIHNVSQFRRLLPSDCAIMPAIKANAYGHGADIIRSACKIAGLQISVLPLRMKALSLEGLVLQDRY